MKKAQRVLSTFIGEPRRINLEPFFDNLFRLRDNFKALGMNMHDGVIFFPDLI